MQQADAVVALPLALTLVLVQRLVQVVDVVLVAAVKYVSSDLAFIARSGDSPLHSKQS